MQGQSKHWLLRAKRHLGRQSPKPIADDSKPPKEQQEGASTHHETPPSPPPDYENIDHPPPDYSLSALVARELDIMEGVDRKIAGLLPYLAHLLGDSSAIEAVCAAIRIGCITTAKAIIKCSTIKTYTENVPKEMKMRAHKAAEAVSLAWEAAASVGKPLGAAVVAANTIAATAYESANARDLARKNAAFFAAHVHRQICVLSNREELGVFGSH
jgi:hypothetical protein